MISLRPYQEEALKAIETAWVFHRAALVVLPTGLGKTTLMGAVCKTLCARRVLMIAHREELVYQAAEEFKLVTGEEVGIEMGVNSVSDSIHLFGGSEPRLVVATVQTLYSDARLGQFEPNDFDALLIDEAHHDVASNAQYLKVRQHFGQNDNLKILGVTATPDRADEVGLAESYETVAYEYSLLTAIDEGWLVPIRQNYVTVEGLDFSALRSADGDLRDCDLEKILADEPEMVHRVASSIVDIAGGRKTLIFSVSVNHAKLIAEVIRRYPGKEDQAAIIHGKTDKDERKVLLARYAKAEIQFMAGCGVFTEGFNDPGIQIVACARPTKSRALHCQMVGRGTRALRGVLKPGMTREERKQAIALSGKPWIEVVDFVGNAGKHSLVSTADLLAGRAPTAAVIRAVERSKGAGGPVDIRAEIRRAEEEIEKEKQAQEEALKIRREKAEAERKKQEEMRRRFRARSTYHVHELDLFGGSSPSQSGGAERDPEPITEKQREFLRRNKYKPEDYTKKTASQLIADLMERRKNGKCTPKQASLLRKYGEAGDMPLTKAKVLLGLLMARRWRKCRDYALTPDRFKIALNHDGTFSPVVMDNLAGRVVISEIRCNSVDAVRETIKPCFELDGVPA